MIHFENRILVQYRTVTNTTALVQYRACIKVPKNVVYEMVLRTYGTDTLVPFYGDKIDFKIVDRKKWMRTFHYRTVRYGTVS